MTPRATNYLIIFFLISIFTASLTYIKYNKQQNEIEYNTDDGTEKDQTGYNKLSRFIYPAIALLSFFISCYFVSKTISIGEDK